MKDVGYERTEQLLKEVEKDVRKEYKQAQRDIQAKLNAYMAQFAAQDKKMKERLKGGQISKKDYKEFLARKIAMGNRWKAFREQLATDYHNANKIAASVVKGYMPEAYAINHNWGTYQVETGSQVDTNYTMYSAEAVERLWRENPKLMPDPSARMQKVLAEHKDLQWNRQHIQSAVMQGIMQGEGIGKIANRLQSVTDMNRNAAMRNARTMVTSAQNGGRLDAYKRAERMGMEVWKVWEAVGDERTRPSHNDIDGESVPVNEEFSNGLEFPADPNGSPDEVYNCRCTMGTEIKHIPTFMEIYEEIANESFDEWTKGHEEAEPEIRSVRIRNIDGQIRDVQRNRAAVDETLRKVELGKKSAVAEIGTAINASGNIVNTTLGTTSKVSPPKSATFGNVFTHNHPSSTIFSWQDIRSALGHNVVELRASTKEGLFFSLSRIEGVKPDKGIVNDYKSATSTAKISAYMKETGVGRIEARNTLGAQFLMLHAGEYGLRFRTGEW